MASKRSCPRWVTRQCWAFVATLVTTIFLGLAIGEPWYIISERGAYGLIKEGVPIVNTGDALILLGWEGAYVHYTLKEKGETLKKERFTTSWFDFNDSRPMNYYMATMSLLIVAFVLCVALGVSILFGLMIYRKRTDVCCGGRTKWILLGLSVVLFIFGLLSWTIFFGITSGLDKAQFNDCPTHKYWCDSFAGVETVTIPGYGVSKIYWGPTDGWIFGVLANAGMIVIMALLLITKNQRRRYAKLGQVEENTEAITL